MNNLVQRLKHGEGEYLDRVVAIQFYTELIDEIDDMSDTEEQELRARFASIDGPLPGDYRSIEIAEAVSRRADAVRACLAEVDIGKLSRDTGYSGLDLLDFESG